jgi:hypothetical protein
MGADQAKATWVFMMLSALSKELKLSPTAFVGLTRDHDLIGFLFANYDLLHFYDNDYVVADALRHIRTSGSSHAAAPTL